MAVAVAVDDNRWTKGNSSVAFDGEPCSFPGKIWKQKSTSAGGASGQWNMLCSAGGSWARYASAGDSLLGPWKLQDRAFASVGGKGKGVGNNGGASVPYNAPAAGMGVICFD